MGHRIYVIRVFLAVAMLAATVTANAQRHGNHLGVGVGALYERGLDATVFVEHEMQHLNTWEYFVSGYLKWDDDAESGHATKQSFWRNYRTWTVGIAYKPCVIRNVNCDKNNYGSLRIGGGIGSDAHEVIGIVTAGYEHDFVLRHGWRLFFQAKVDACINGRDLFRTGVVIGVKLPTNLK